jgi:hypothetical protein
MIYLYYTGAVAFNKPQQDITKSLGGNISSSIIPNSRLNSLFSDNSLHNKNTSEVEVICVAVKNIATIDLTNFSLYCEFNQVELNYTIEAAVVLPSLDECNNFVFEKLNSTGDLPYYGEFHDIVSEAHKINMGTFTKDTYIGIFLCKKYVGNLNNQSYCEPIDPDLQTEANKIEEIAFKFSWD